MVFDPVETARARGRTSRSLLLPGTRSSPEPIPITWHPNLPETLGQFCSVEIEASGYAKRMMESQYDRLMETGFGQKLRGLDKTYRYGIEAGLHALGAVIEQILPEDKPAVMFFKQILEDAPAEIARRLLTGVRGDLRLAFRDAKTQERDGNYVTLGTRR